MAQVSQIEIDIDVYKKIEMSRKSFEETPNSILRRLLIEGDQPAIVQENGANRASWSGKGVTLPHDTELEMTYNGVTHKGVIVNGRWKVGTQFYTSPLDAASGVSKLITGDRKSLNGWIYWIAKLPNQPLWKKLADIRKLEEQRAKDRQHLTNH